MFPNHSCVNKNPQFSLFSSHHSYSLYSLSCLPWMLVTPTPNWNLGCRVSSMCVCLHTIHHSTHPNNISHHFKCCGITFSRVNCYVFRDHLTSQVRDRNRAPSSYADDVCLLVITLRNMYVYQDVTMSD